MAKDYPLFINITYDPNKDKYKVRTNVKREGVEDLIDTFLRGQIGAGSDSRKAEKREVYHINMQIDLSDDSFNVSDDTGNFGLRDGILLGIRGKWSLEREARKAG